MNDALLVRALERVGDLPRDGNRVVEGDRALSNAVRQRRTFDEFQHQRVHAGRILQAVDVSDVRVVERGEHLRLAAEARQAIGIGGEELGQDFDRDVAIELRVARAIHLAHAARTQRFEDFVGPDPRAYAHRH